MLRAISSMGALALVFGCSAPAETTDLSTAQYAEQPAMTVMSDSGDYQVELRSIPEALPIRGNNGVRLTVLSADSAEPVPDLELVMVPFMPSMGHGNGSQPKGEAVDLGVYEFEDVTLTMPGLWELRTKIAGAASDSVVLAFNVH